MTWHTAILRFYHRGAQASTDGKAFTGTGPERGSTPRPSTTRPVTADSLGSNPGAEGSTPSGCATTDSSSGRTPGCYPVNGGSSPSSVAITVDGESYSFSSSIPPPHLTDEEWLNATYAVVPRRFTRDGFGVLLDAYRRPPGSAIAEPLRLQPDPDHVDYCPECARPR